MTYQEKIEEMKNDVETKIQNTCMTAEVSVYPKLSNTKNWYNSPLSELEKGVHYNVVCHNVLDVIEGEATPSCFPHPDAIQVIKNNHPGWILVYID